MPSKTHTKVFNLYPEGPDSDYGVIYNEIVKVTVEQSWEWDEEMVKDMKESLAEYFDVRVGGVQTDEDIAAETEHWEEAAKKFIPSEPDPSDPIIDLPF